MASKENLTEQLSLTLKLTAAVDQMAKAVARVESSYDTQTAAVEKLAQAIEGLKSKDLSELNGTKLNTLQKELRTTEERVSGLTGRIKSLGEQASKKFPKAALIGAAALTGLHQGFRSLTALGKGVGGFFTSVVDWVGSITSAIVSIPLQILNGLVKAAASADGGMNELAQAIENLRKEMGDLKGPGASAVLEVTKTLKGFADTGLSAYRVFGFIHERLEHVTKVAVAMGATFGVLTKEFRENGGALLAFQKGLGASEEGMKAIGDRAISIGKPMTKVFMDMTKQTLALGKAFDIDQKLIGKDMAKALQNVKHFGALTVKEIAQASVYARKLGIELDKITGTLDAFETFDSAAENAAKLSQSFGVQIDAFKMMEAQNPAEQLDMLRKSFRDAGVDASTFTRQQARLLAMTTGLDEATVRQTFSAQNYGVSLDDVKKKSALAEKRTMSQAEAMSKLADSIERMVKSGPGLEGSFFKMFLKGISAGIQSSKEFREIMWNIRRGLYTVYFEGIRLGRAIVQLFPGVKQILGAFADFFKPGKFKALAGGVTDEIIAWMKGLTDTNGKGSFSALMTRLRNKFFNFFDASTSQGRQLLDGFRTLFKVLSHSLADGIRWVSGQVAEAMKLVIGFIKDPSKLLSGAGGAAGSGFGFLVEIMTPLLEALKDSWKIVSPVLLDLVKLVGSKLYEFIRSDAFINTVKPALPFVAAILFGPAFARALLAAGVASLGKAAVGLFASSGGRSIMENIASRASSEVLSASKRVSARGARDAAAGIKQVGAVNAAAGAAIKPAGAGTWGVQDAVRLGAKLVAIAAALAVGGVMMAGAIVAMKKVLLAGGLKTVSDVTVPLLVLGSMVVAAVPLMLSMKIASKAGSLADVVKGGLVIGAAVSIVGAVGAGLAYLLKNVAGPSQLSAAGDIMLKMSLVFLAMVPLIFASMAIGVLASGPQALALAAAAQGLAIVGIAVAEMAAVSVGIVQQLAKLKIDADFQRKIDAFLGIMKSVQAFADTLVRIIDAMAPSFTELISGRTESFTDKVNQAKGLIGVMVGKRGSGTGMIGIVETVMQAIKDLNVGGPGMLEAANVFSNVMQGITGFMQAAVPPDAFYAEGGKFINRLVDPTHNFQTLATDVGYYAKLMREGAMEMLTGSKDGRGKTTGGILGVIETMATLPVPNVQAAGAIANLIGATANVLKALTPNAETMKAFTQSKDISAYWGLARTTVSKMNTDDFTKALSGMSSSLQALLPTLINDVVGRVASMGKNLTKDQIENVKVIADLMGTVSSVASSVATMAKGKKMTPTDVAGAVHWTTEEAPNIAEIFTGMSKHLPKLFESVINVVSNMKVGASFMARLTDAKKVFEFLSEVPKLAQSLASVQVKGSSSATNVEPLIKSIKSMTTFMRRLVADYGRSPIDDLMSSAMTVVSSVSKVGGDSITKAAGTLKGMFEGLSAVGVSLKQVSTLTSVNPDRAAQVVTNIATAVSRTIEPLTTVRTTLTPDVMRQVQASVEQLRAYNDQVQKITTSIKDGGIGQSLKAAADMVKLANDLDKALSSGVRIDTPVKLGRIAQGVGLGGKYNYTVQSKEIVINMNVQVTMNVDDVEKVLILRKNSIVRDRLNLALDGDKATQPAKLPDNTNSPVVVPFARTGE